MTDPAYTQLSPVLVPSITGGGVTAPFTAAIPLASLAGLVDLFLSALAVAGDTVRPWLVADGTTPAGNSGTPAGGNAVRILDVNGNPVDLVGGGALAQLAIPDAQLTGFLVLQRIADSGAVVYVEIQGLSTGASGARPSYGAITAPTGTAHLVAISTAQLPGYITAGLSRNATGGDSVRVWWTSGDVAAGAGAPAQGTSLGDLVGGASTAILQIPPSSQPGWITFQRLTGATVITLSLATGGNSGADSGQGSGGGGGPSGPAYIQSGNTYAARGIIGLKDNNAWDFITNSLVRMTILGGASASGFVGIGIATPTARLHVVEPTTGTTLFLARFAANASVGLAVGFENTSGASRQVQLVMGGPITGTNNWALVTDPAAASLQRFQIIDLSPNVARLDIDAAGKVAIGPAQAAVGAQLDVQGSTGGIGFPNMTTTQRNTWAALPPAKAGSQIFNTTTGGYEFWNGATVVPFSLGLSPRKFAGWDDINVVTQTTAQFVTPGSGAVTSTTLKRGTIQESAGTVSQLVVSFIGDAANGAQTLTFQVVTSTDGGATYAAVAGGVTTALATTAGQKTATIAFTPVAVAVGDLVGVTCAVGVAPLTAVCTNVAASVR